MTNTCAQCTCYTCRIRHNCYCRSCSKSVPKARCSTKRTMTVGEVLNDGDEQAAMELAAELAERAGENPIRPDFVRGQIEKMREEMDGRSA